jgi:hypothetical protein
MAQNIGQTISSAGKGIKKNQWWLFNCPSGCDKASRSKTARIVVASNQRCSSLSEISLIGEEALLKIRPIASSFDRNTAAIYRQACQRTVFF